MLVCPSCSGLIHSARLKQLAAEADQAQGRGDGKAAIATWRSALELLPSGTRQYGAIEARIASLSQMQPAATAQPADQQSWFRRGWGALAAGIIFLLSKAKLLLLGLTKMGTLFSMLAFLGVYWSMWGWKFALGFVIGIYIHEMGHVAALRRYGIDASAPMFIPGIGAFVRLKQHVTDPRQDARVGLAGPVWGLAAALVAWLTGKLTGSTLWLGIAQSTAFINLFNLIPFWQLDGGRGFHSLNRMQRIAAAVVVGLAWAYTSQGLLAIILVLAIWQAFAKAPSEPDYGALGTYAGLIVVISWLTSTRVV